VNEGWDWFSGWVAKINIPWPWPSLCSWPCHGCCIQGVKLSRLQQHPPKQYSFILLNNLKRSQLWMRYFICQAHETSTVMFFECGMKTLSTVYIQERWPQGKE
jgi:hypothetical protein